MFLRLVCKYEKLVLFNVTRKPTRQDCLTSLNLGQIHPFLFNRLKKELLEPFCVDVYVSCFSLLLVRVKTMGKPWGTFSFEAFDIYVGCMAKK